MIVDTLGRYADVRHSIVEDSKYLIGVFQEPATPLPCREHHDPPDTPPPSSSSSSTSGSGRPEFATPTKPAPGHHHHHSSSANSHLGAHSRLSSSSSSSSSMKPPSLLHPQHRRDNLSAGQLSASSRPGSSSGLHKAPGPGPGGGYPSSGGNNSNSASSSSSSQRPQSSSSSSAQRPGPPGSSTSLQRPHPPKLAFNQPPSTPESPDVNDILKEMKFAAMTPLTAIAATPRKEPDRFDFNGPLPPLHHPTVNRRMPPASSGKSLMDDLSLSDSDQDSEVEPSVGQSEVPPTTVSSVLSPLPEPPLMSVPSPLGPLSSPPPPRLQPSQPSGNAVTASALSEPEESDDESSSESEGSSSDSSSGHSEPDTTKPASSSSPPRVTAPLN